jgi:hypothetical protein
LKSDGSNCVDWKLKLQLIIASEDLVDVLKHDASALGTEATDEDKAMTERYHKNK